MSSNPTGEPMKLVTDQDEIYKLLRDDPDFTEAVYRDEQGVYLQGGDGESRRYITQLGVTDEENKDGE